MKLNVLDASGFAQQIITQGIEALVDKSGTITATGVAQQAIAANSTRSGYIIQNKGSNIMYVNDLGTATVGVGSFSISPGDYFPPAGYPMTGNAVSIIGTINDVFSAREW